MFETVLTNPILIEGFKEYNKVHGFCCKCKKRFEDLDGKKIDEITEVIEQKV